jgi:hypothetical protein
MKNTNLKVPLTVLAMLAKSNTPSRRRAVRKLNALSALLRDSQLPDERIAVFRGHPDIANQHIRPCSEESLERFRRGACQRNRCAGHLQ